MRTDRRTAEGKTILKIIYRLVILYVILLTLMFVFQRKLLYFPTPLSEFQISNSAPFTILEIRTNDGLSLRSWQAKGDPEKKTFIFFHGNAGNAADRIAAMGVLLQAGHSVVLAEYRGYGSNPGKPSEDKLIMDARRLMDEIIKQGVNERDIILMGRSLGAGVATSLATEYDVAALVLISAYSSLPEVAAEYYPFFPVSLLMRDRFNNLDKIENIAAPLLVFHGEMDQIIPLHHGLKVYDAAQGKKEFIRLPGLGHNNLDMDQINRHILGQLQ